MASVTTHYEPTRRYPRCCRPDRGIYRGHQARCTQVRRQPSQDDSSDLFSIAKVGTYAYCTLLLACLELMGGGGELTVHKWMPYQFCPKIEGMFSGRRMVARSPKILLWQAWQPYCLLGTHRWLWPRTQLFKAKYVHKAPNLGLSSPSESSILVPLHKDMGWKHGNSGGTSLACLHCNRGTY